MKKLVVGLLALMLSSCGPQQATDGYVFEKADFTVTDLRIKLVYHKDIEDLRKAHKERTGGVLPGVKAWTSYNAFRPGVCEIHLVDMTKYYEPEFAGHEFLHCVHGNFHPNQG